MKVKTVDTTDADRKSAKIFFDALTSFYDFSQGYALDAFARNGQLTVDMYKDDVFDLDLWELGSEHEEALEAFDPRDVKIGCSYKTLAACDYQYDLVVVDTPQGLHRAYDDSVKVEHFDFLREIEPILKDNAVIVVYCNKNPYNKDEEGEHGYDVYEEYNYSEWMKRRESFYGRAKNVTLDEMYSAYESVLMGQKLDIVNTIVVPCYSDVEGRNPYAFRMALEVRRL